MSRLSLIFLFLCVSHFAEAQEVYKIREHYGLKYDGAQAYAAVFDEITIKEYFVMGRMGSTYYNLSRKKDNADKIYKEFDFTFWGRLLVIGKTLDGKIDILDETGQYYYLNNGDYSKILPNRGYDTYGADDVLLTKAKGKLGLYHWPQKKEVLPPAYDKITIHESCNEQDYFIYTKTAGVNSILDQDANTLMSFKSHLVDDMYPPEICIGYLIKTKGMLGYCFEKSNGKYFLIKPYFDNIIFPWGDTSLILVERNDKLGLYYNHQRLLKAKYESIEILDDEYLLARVKRGEQTYVLDKSGHLARD